MLHEQTERQRLHHYGSMCGAAALTPAAAVARQDVQEIPRHKIEQKKKKKLNGEGKKRGARRFRCGPHIANWQGGFCAFPGIPGFSHWHES